MRLKLIILIFNLDPFFLPAHICAKASQHSIRQTKDVYMRAITGLDVLPNCTSSNFILLPERLIKILHACFLKKGLYFSCQFFPLFFMVICIKQVMF